MSRSKRFFRVVIVMLLIIGMTAYGEFYVEASNEPPPIIFRWANVQSADAKISSSGKTITASISVVCYNSSTNISGTLYLEKESDGSWYNVDSWPVSARGTLRTSKRYIGSKGSTYRARFDVTAGEDSIESTSSSCMI
jgi:hypothetical protein